MKKKIIALLIVATAILFSGCNKTILDTNYTFDTVIIQRYDGEQILKIKSWKDYDGEQIQLELEDGSIVLVSSYNAILVNTKNGTSLILD